MAVCFQAEFVEDGILKIVLDTPNSWFNVLNATARKELRQLLDELAEEPGIRAAYVKSAKANSFLGGADLKEILALSSPEEALASEVEEVEEVEVVSPPWVVEVASSVAEPTVESPQARPRRRGRARSGRWSGTRMAESLAAVAGGVHGGLRGAAARPTERRSAPNPPRVALVCANASAPHRGAATKPRCARPRSRSPQAASARRRGSRARCGARRRGRRGGRPRAAAARGRSPRGDRRAPPGARR